MAQSALAEADWTAIAKIIRDQMAALRRDDGAAAFSHAVPGIRRQFSTAENFMRMVRTGYRAVYRPRRRRGDCPLHDGVTERRRLENRGLRPGAAGREADLNPPGHGEESYWGAVVRGSPVAA